MSSLGSLDAKAHEVGLNRLLESRLDLPLLHLPQHLVVLGLRLGSHGDDLLMELLQPQGHFKQF